MSDMNRLFVLDLYDTPDLDRHEIGEFVDTLVSSGFEVLIVVPESAGALTPIGAHARAIECPAGWTPGRRINYAVALAVPAATYTFASGVFDGAVTELVDGIDGAAATSDSVVLESRVGTPAGPEALAYHAHDPRRVFTVTSASYDSVRGVDQNIGAFGECVEDLAQRVQWTGARRVVCSVGDLDSSREWIAPEEPQFKFLEGRPIIANLPRWEFAPEKPLVSVVIATRDRARYLPDAISSVLGQSMSNLELIVVDDGSADETQDVLRSVTDPRLRWFSRPATGISAARNFATSQARGEWIAVHDDDDIMVSDRIELQLRTLSRGTDAVYGAWANFHDETGEMLVHLTRQRFGMPVVLHNGQTPGHPTWLVRRSLLEAVPYDERLTSAVDHDVATRALRLGTTWVHCGQVVTLRRIHDAQVSAVDGTAQKSAARISRILQGVGLREEDRRAVAAAQSDYRWPVMRNRAKPFDDLGGDLPDHLIERVVIARGRPFNGVVEARLQEKVRAVANVLEEGRPGSEFVVLGDVTLGELGELRSRGVDVVVLHKRRRSRGGTIVDWERILLNSIVRDRRPTHTHVGVVAFGEYDTPRGAVVTESCAIVLRSDMTGLVELTLWIVEQDRSEGLMARLARSHPQELVDSLSGDVTEGVL
ncbi:hypothetical protein GCM10027063_33180 [Promicromonospora xylanilytica]